jgi:SAM-dependent methyltransferase
VTELEKSFEDLNPWSTRFLIGDQEYGGSYKAYEDIRISQFETRFSKSKHILELGSLEGGHSIRLALNHKVTAIEGRKKNIEKSEFIKKLFFIGDELKFVESNLDMIKDFSDYKDCDVVFCVGVLYHLDKPWELIEKISKITKNLFVWTHYIKDEEVACEENGYKGKRMGEGTIEISTDGLTPFAFWFNKESLLRMFEDNGFKNLVIVRDHIDLLPKPAITLSFGDK